MNKLIEYIEQQIREYKSRAEEQVQELGNSGDEEWGRVEAYKDILKQLRDIEYVDSMVASIPDKTIMFYLYCDYSRLEFLSTGDNYKGFTVVKYDGVPLDRFVFSPYEIDTKTITENK